MPVSELKQAHTAPFQNFATELEQFLILQTNVVVFCVAFVLF